MLLRSLSRTAAVRCAATARGAPACGGINSYCTSLSSCTARVVKPSGAQLHEIEGVDTTARCVQWPVLACRLPRFQSAGFHASSRRADGEDGPDEAQPAKGGVEFMSVEDSVARLMDRSQMSNRETMKDEFREIAQEFGGNEFNTGLSEVQIAIMTRKIANMTDFLKKNRKDKHNIRALQLLLSKRRKMLKYLMRQSRSRYYNTIQKLGLRDVYGDKVLKRRGAKKKYPAARMRGAY